MSPSWSVVFGRRGTGKTTLLHALSNEIDRDGIERNAAISISVQNCIVDLPNSISDELRALVYFEKFVTEIGLLLFRIYANRTAPKNWQRKIAALFRLNGGNRNFIQGLILKLATFAYNGISFGALSKKTTEMSETVTGSQSAEAGLGVGIDLADLANPAKFRLSADAAIRKNIETVGHTKYVEERFIDFAQLKRDFSELIEAIGLDSIYILVDEWSYLDRSGARSVQPIFSEYLKRCFHGNSHFCVKIFAIKTEAKLNEVRDGVPCGLDTNDDIRDEIDLDKIYVDNSINIENFYSELMFRRLLYCNKKLKVLADREDSHRPVDNFWELIFKEGGSFHGLTRASNGNPRDFVILFDRIAQTYDHKVDELWALNRVRTVIMEERINFQEREVAVNDHTRVLLECIRKTVAKTKRRTFFIDSNHSKLVDEALVHLYIKRYIHVHDKTMISYEMRKNFVPYFIDYGCYLDWIGVKNINLDDIALFKNIDETERNVSDFIVDTSDLSNL
jgi:hypothetical protein